MGDFETANFLKDGSIDNDPCPYFDHLPTYLLRGLTNLHLEFTPA